MNESDRVLNDLQENYPGTNLVKKDDSAFMKVINILLMIITFGQMKTFMTNFVTTIGRTIYVNKDWEHRTPHQQAMVLRHEGVHIAQEARIGFLKYKFMYLFWVFPTLCAVGRRDLEQEAYSESMRARAEYFGVKTLRHKGYKEHMLSIFSGPSYFWMWPWKKQLNEWFDSTLAEIEKDYEEKS